MEFDLKNKIAKLVEAKGLSINYVKYGTASRIKNTILLNVNMLKEPEFCLEVIDHELRHSSSYKLNDLMMDLFEGSMFKTLKFMLKYPSAFIQLLPFGKYKGEWFIDINLLITYLLIIVMGAISLWIIV